MKGTDQPIWILVAILLALVVGVAMYQMMGKANLEEFDDIIKNTDESTAQITIESFCLNSYRSKWTNNPTEKRLEDITKSAVSLGWISREEWDNYAKFTNCDCAVYLYVTESSSITRSEVHEIYNPSACHTYANKQAIKNGLTG